MVYDGQFQSIDPLHGPLTEVFGVSTIAGRARALLVSRSTGELEAAAGDIGLLMGQAWAERAAQAGEDTFTLLSNEDIHDAQLLREVLDAYEAESNPRFPDARAYEYFAVLALCHAVDASLWVSGAHASRPPWGLRTWPENMIAVQAEVIERQGDPVFRLERTGRHALEALEAVCLAEVNYRTDATADVRARQIISKTNSENGRKAHEETNRMKAECEVWYWQNAAKFPSVNAAASALVEMVPVKWTTART